MTGNLSASILARLLTLAKQRGDDYNLLLNRFGMERLLARVSTSPHANRFLLKDALRAAMRPWPVRWAWPGRSRLRCGARPFSDKAHKVPLAPMPRRPERGSARMQLPRRLVCRHDTHGPARWDRRRNGLRADLPAYCSQTYQAREQGPTPGQSKRAQPAHTAPMYSPRAG